MCDLYFFTKLSGEYYASTNYSYLSIQNAFLNHLSENLIVSHRIQNIYLILKVTKEFNLQAKEWAEDALIKKTTIMNCI